MSASNVTYDYCDSDALPAESTNVSSLLHNHIYKVCPGMHQHFNGTIARLGQPRCGDGTNYSFLVTRPEEQPDQQQQQGEKILIELIGGGACWDELTCALQKSFLTFPTWLGSIVGTSCSGQFGDMMLCAKTVGSTDFSEYTTIIIPYCTQDIHMGDEPNSTYGVRHVGAHNIYRTLQWIFENFPNPSEFFITGCSAGGSPLPVVYDLINTHYNNIAEGENNSVQIDLIADSPVFLTPLYFVENSMHNYNLGTIFNEIGFDFEAYKDTEALPSQILDYVLQRSKATDSFGYVSSDADAVSLFYYKMMRTGSGGDRALSANDPRQYERDESAASISNFQRRTDDIEAEWWNKTNNVFVFAMNEHANFDVFIANGTGHCTFSLNAPLQYDGFEEWASNILTEKSSIGQQGNVAAQSVPSSIAVTAIVTLTLRFLFGH